MKYRNRSFYPLFIIPLAVSHTAINSAESKLENQNLKKCLGKKLTKPISRVYLYNDENLHLEQAQQNTQEIDLNNSYFGKSRFAKQVKQETSEHTWQKNGTSWNAVSAAEYEHTSPEEQSKNIIESHHPSIVAQIIKNQQGIETLNEFIAHAKKTEDNTYNAYLKDTVKKLNGSERGDRYREAIKKQSLDLELLTSKRNELLLENRAHTALLQQEIVNSAASLRALSKIKHKLTAEIKGVEKNKPHTPQDKKQLTQYALDATYYILEKDKRAAQSSYNPFRAPMTQEQALTELLERRALPSHEKQTIIRQLKNVPTPKPENDYSKSLLLLDREIQKLAQSRPMSSSDLTRKESELENIEQEINDRSATVAQKIALIINHNKEINIAEEDTYNMIFPESTKVENKEKAIEYFQNVITNQKQTTKEQEKESDLTEYYNSIKENKKIAHAAHVAGSTFDLEQYKK